MALGDFFSDIFDSFTGKAQRRFEQRSLELQQQRANQSQAIEQARRRQAEQDARRRQRDIIRQAAVARATSLAVTGNQGAGDSSAAQGSLFQIESQKVQQTEDLENAFEIGGEIFGLNERIAQLSGQIATQESNIRRADRTRQATLDTIDLGLKLFDRFGE